MLGNYSFSESALEKAQCGSCYICRYECINSTKKNQVVMLMNTKLIIKSEKWKGILFSHENFTRVSQFIEPYLIGSRFRMFTESIENGKKYTIPTKNRILTAARKNHIFFCLVCLIWFYLIRYYQCSHARFIMYLYARPVVTTHFFGKVLAWNWPLNDSIRN